MKIPLLCCSFIFVVSNLFSQDIIIKRNWEKLQVRIIEVSTTEIKYKKFKKTDGPTYSILKDEIALIKYENDSTQALLNPLDKKAIGHPFFNENHDSINKSSISVIKASNNDYFSKGKEDAAKFYSNYKYAGTGTLVVSLLSPLAGIVPAVVCSSKDPKIKNLNYPDDELFKNIEYNKGYIKKAKRIKSGRVWTNWLVAFGANLFVYVLISSNQK